MTVMISLDMIRRGRRNERPRKEWLGYILSKRGTSELFPLASIINEKYLDDCLWTLRCLPDDMAGPVQLLSCEFAETVLQFVAEGDSRPRLAIEAARSFVAGTITWEQRYSAWLGSSTAVQDATWAAAWAEPSTAGRADAIPGESGPAGWAMSWNAARAGIRAGARAASTDPATAAAKAASRAAGTGSAFELVCLVAKDARNAARGSVSEATKAGQAEILRAWCETYGDQK